jgi:hypothetical protein
LTLLACPDAFMHQVLGRGKEDGIYRQTSSSYLSAKDSLGVTPTRSEYRRLAQFGRLRASSHGMVFMLTLMAKCIILTRVPCSACINGDKRDTHSVVSAVPVRGSQNLDDCLCCSTRAGHRWVPLDALDTPPTARKDAFLGLSGKDQTRTILESSLVVVKSASSGYDMRARSAAQAPKFHPLGNDPLPGTRQAPRRRCLRLHQEAPTWKAGHRSPRTNVDGDQEDEDDALVLWGIRSRFRRRSGMLGLRRRHGRRAWRCRSWRGR